MIGSQILAGDRIASSDYKLNFLDESCKVLCAKHWNEKEVAEVKERIDNEYMVRRRPPAVTVASVALYACVFV